MLGNKSLVDTQRRGFKRFLLTIAFGLILGGLLTALAGWLPASAAREFLTTSVTPFIGPFSVDLIAVAFTIGPLSLKVNVLSLVGIAVVALIARSWI